eukprot:6200301-Heterocapsa_arctica.AAC.1
MSHEDLSYLGGPCDLYSRPGTDQEDIEVNPTAEPSSVHSRSGPRGRESITRNQEGPYLEGT